MFFHQRNQTSIRIVFRLGKTFFTKHFPCIWTVIMFELTVFCDSKIEALDFLKSRMLDIIGKNSVNNVYICLNCHTENKLKNENY